MPEFEDDVLRRVAAAARRRWPDAVVAGLRRLDGGVSSLTFAATLRTGGERRQAVVKVAPPGLAPVRNRDVLRQARILRLLTRLDGPPVPGVLFEDHGTPPLFAMEFRQGDSYEPALDVHPAPPSADIAAGRMRTAARALAALHREPPVSLDLGAEPVIPVTDELTRWYRLFATVDADIAPGHEKLHARLAERVPKDTAPRLLHGDYRLANMLFVDTVLTAVIDWEIWSVGDPRSDLAWLLMHSDPAHVFHEHRSPADVAAGSALPTVDELLAEYVAVSGVPITDLAWFLALCYYKTASTTAAIIKRDRRRPVRDPKLVVAERHLADVLAAGHAALEVSRSTR